GFAFVALFSIWFSVSLSLFLGWLVYTLLIALIAGILFKRAERKQQELPLFRKDTPVTADRPRRDDPSESDRVAADARASNALGRGSTGA
ncbi:MAG: hypothetical protein R3362_06610, partial [Rhodothermales bacterium]|nr:hypothetical protein [Rhodothermales bacterium]